uniref:Uncharacterized protein n=1 Tax=Globisporangium ultimum (strain ATCC 200006 / CBS 805.95 / DAOM BR144) TaxID=431595 RepID=K3WCG2_GLOUD
MASRGGGSRRKALLAHLSAALAEVEGRTDAFRAGIEQLERNTRADLSPRAVREWFQMYLRVFDIGVEIRRGEIRHRTARQFQYPCMHTTGTRGATHSGLSIDDANAIYQLLESTPGVSESRLSVLFMRMDSLDNDSVGTLDVRLNGCLAKLLSVKSAHYYGLELSGSDPHQELFVKGIHTVESTRRTCFNPSTCVCEVDVEPWHEFEVPDEPLPAREKNVPAASPNHAGGTNVAAVTSGASAAATENAAANEEIGISELKRRFGFEPQVVDVDDDDNNNFTKKRRLAGRFTAGQPEQPVVWNRLTPLQIYMRKCRESGVEQKKKLRDLFIVTNGALNLNLSEFGLHSPENLQDLLDVVTAADLPIVSLDVTNNFFNAKSFQIFCELLRLPKLVQNAQRLIFRCVALPQRSDFPTLLRNLSNTENGELAQLRELDLSYNTFSEDSVLCLDSLLTGLKRLEKLSLESCFTKAPDPEVVEVAVVKDLVRTALVTCCNQLKSLNFGSNWMSFPLLNSLFAPESALQELSITQMTFFCFETAGFDSSMWDFNFQQLESLTLSETKHSRSDYLVAFLEALVASFTTGFVQMKRLDLAIGTGAAGQANSYNIKATLDAMIIALLQQIGDYGALRSLRIRMDMPLHYESMAPNYERVMLRLLAGGLPECESLDLSLGLPLTIASLRTLIGAAQLPKAQKIKLSITTL